MKKLFAFLFSISILCSLGQNPEWKKEQLMPAKELADKINANTKDKPLIFNVGPMDNIKTAVSLGFATNATFGERLKSALTMESKNKAIVVYCGCCSSKTCPNIKPAYDMLLSLGFKNTKILDIPENLKPDWVAKGYPMEK